MCELGRWEAGDRVLYRIQGGRMFITLRTRFGYLELQAFTS